jgi:hypothetical protein
MGYLGKGEMLTNMDVNKFVNNTFERNKLFVLMEHFWDLLFQLMKKWDQHFTCCICIFVPYIYGTPMSCSHAVFVFAKEGRLMFWLK